MNDDWEEEDEEEEVLVLFDETEAERSRKVDLVRRMLGKEPKPEPEYFDDVFDIDSFR